MATTALPSIPTADVGHDYTTTGLPHRKIAIWAFIGSECMLFASLISTYLIYKGRSVVGPFPHEAWTDPSTGHVYRRDPEHSRDVVLDVRPPHVVAGHGARAGRGREP